MYVWGNPITVEGARLILQSAVNNGVCQEVCIDQNYSNDDEVKKMIIIWSRNRR